MNEKKEEKEGQSHLPKCRRELFQCSVNENVEAPCSTLTQSVCLDNSMELSDFELIAAYDAAAEALESKTPIVDKAEPQTTALIECAPVQQTGLMVANPQSDLRTDDAFATFCKMLDSWSPAASNGKPKDATPVNSVPARQIVMKQTSQLPVSDTDMVANHQPEISKAADPTNNLEQSQHLEHADTSLSPLQPTNENVAKVIENSSGKSIKELPSSKGPSLKPYVKGENDESDGEDNVPLSLIKSAVTLKGKASSLHSELGKGKAKSVDYAKKAISKVGCSVSRKVPLTMKFQALQSNSNKFSKVFNCPKKAVANENKNPGKGKARPVIDLENATAVQTSEVRQPIKKITTQERAVAKDKTTLNTKKPSMSNGTGETKLVEEVKGARGAKSVSERIPNVTSSKKLTPKLNQNAKIVVKEPSYNDDDNTPLTKLLAAASSVKSNGDGKKISPPTKRPLKTLTLSLVDTVPAKKSKLEVASTKALKMNAKNMSEKKLEVPATKALKGNAKNMSQSDKKIEVTATKALKVNAKNMSHSDKKLESTATKAVKVNAKNMPQSDQKLPLKVKGSLNNKSSTDTKGITDILMERNSSLMSERKKDSSKRGRENVAPNKGATPSKIPKHKNKDVSSDITVNFHNTSDDGETSSLPQATSKSVKSSDCEKCKVPADSHAGDFTISLPHSGASEGEIFSYGNEEGINFSVSPSLELNESLPYDSSALDVNEDTGVTESQKSGSDSVLTKTGEKVLNALTPCQHSKSSVKDSENVILSTPGPSNGKRFRKKTTSPQTQARVLQSSALSSGNGSRSTVKDSESVIFSSPGPSNGKRFRKKTTSPQTPAGVLQSSALSSGNGSCSTRSSQRKVSRPVYMEVDGDGDFGSSDSDEDFDITTIFANEVSSDESDGKESDDDEEWNDSRAKTKMTPRISRATPRNNHSKKLSSSSTAKKSSRNPPPKKQRANPIPSSSDGTAFDDKSDASENEDNGWKDDDLEEQVRPCPDFDPPDDVQQPIDYFKFFWDDDFFQFFANETNRYSTHRDGVSINVTAKEMQVFIAIWIYMGICKLPCYRDYWSVYTRVPQVADLMPLKRFEKIRSRFHLVDDNEETDDRLGKVRPLLNQIREKCNQLVQKENQFSIDESMVLYKGKKAKLLRQYMPNKPHKWGFKFFLLCGISGIAYDFIPYLGADTFNGMDLTDEEKQLGIGGQVVVALCKRISMPRLSVVCFDNYFTGIPLLKYLKDKMGLLSTGTVRSNRLAQCPLVGDKELIQRGRGSSDVKILDDSIACVKWVDNKTVTLASTVAGVAPQSTVQRWSKTQGTRDDISCPNVVKQYNAMMGGVDHFDMLVELYRTSTRAKRWYIPIVGFMLSLALVNGWLVYSRDCVALNTKKEVKNSKEFRLHVFNSLIVSEKRRGRPAADEPKALKVIKSPVVPRPVAAERRDDTDHWPGYADKRNRCRNCTDGFSDVMCLKCGMMLCFRRTKNCFVQFHRDP